MACLTQEEINNIDINVKNARTILGIIAVVNFISSFTGENMIIASLFQVFFGYYLFQGSNPMRWFFIICMSFGFLFMYGLMFFYQKVAMYTFFYGTLNLIFVILLAFNKDVKNYCKYYKKQQK